MVTSTPIHPQANGQAASSNKIIVNNLKKILGKKKARWTEEIPFILWENRTTIDDKRSKAYCLVLGAEVMIPTKVVIPTTT